MRARHNQLECWRGMADCCQVTVLFPCRCACRGQRLCILCCVHWLQASIRIWPSLLACRGLLSCRHLSGKCHHR